MSKFILSSLILWCTLLGCIIPKDMEDNALKGVWLTNVASDALYSKDKIIETVERIQACGFNHIFVVTWNDAQTTYPSSLMKNLTGVEIQPDFEGRDPLNELIEEAHKRNLKVHAWFEFGFSSSHKKTDGGPIINQKPHWAAIDKEGNIVSKNEFQWMNAFHPEVQSFIIELVMEVVKNYDIDGIQGDDRLPACPTSSGYDDYTTHIYQSEHGGANPPSYEKDYEWVKWRSSKLTQFLKNLVKEIRNEKPDIIISMAPSIYPWSEVEYLQDWPTWVNSGLVDWVIPQVYRYSVDKYEYELIKILNEQIHKSQHFKMFPGILLQVDNYNPTIGMLDSMININRNHNIKGEVYFFYEGIKKFEDYFKKLYTN